MKIIGLSLLLLSNIVLGQSSKSILTARGGFINYTKEGGAAPYFELSIAARLKGAGSIGAGAGFTKLPNIGESLPFFLRFAVTPDQAKVAPAFQANIGYTLLNKRFGTITYTGGFYAMITGGISMRVSDKARTLLQVGYTTIGTRKRYTETRIEQGHAEGIVVLLGITL